MKTVFVGITEKEKIEFRELKLNANIVYREILIPLEMLNKRVFESDRGILNKIRAHFFDKKLISILNDKKSDKIYVLSKTLENAEKKSALSSVKKYIQDIFAKLKYEYYTYNGKIEENVDNYLNEELLKRNVEKSDAKILMVYENSKKINFYLVEKLITEYKTIDIYCVDGKNKEAIKRIDKINEEYGSSVCIKRKLSKQEAKATPYDVCIYMEKSDFKIPNASKIYLWDNDSDKFDKYVIMANKNKIINDVNKDYFLYMAKNYGRLKVISLLCKTILDKNLKII